MLKKGTDYLPKTLLCNLMHDGLVCFLINLLKQILRKNLLKKKLREIIVIRGNPTCHKKFQDSQRTKI